LGIVGEKIQTMSMNEKHAPSGPYDVLVVGGGAAGMMAATVAAEAGKRVLLLEKNDSLGNKLNISGGGRCNITNAEYDSRILLTHYGKAAKFLHSPFARFAVKETFDFFAQRGLPLTIEPRRRAFPVSQKASDVTAVFIKALQRGQADIVLDCGVTSLNRRDNRIRSVSTTQGEFQATSYVLATGGMSRPETGSTGAGFGWLKALGHTVRQPSPGIVPLATKETWVARLGGKTVDGRVTFFLDGKRQLRTEGRILFTHFGLSGPTILNCAAQVGDLLQLGNVTAEIDLFPRLDAGACDRQLVALLELHKNKALKTVLKEWLPGGLWQVPTMLLPTLDTDVKVHSLSRDDRKRLVNLVKAIPLTISHLMGFDRAVVADGGVDLREIDMRTMRSTKIANLLVVGDLLDVSRPSGGYSLQLCWTTGFVAGQSLTNPGTETGQAG
jgi:predicted Rossmann fold flavoprotein